MVSEIKFQFEPEKLVQALAYFAGAQLPSLDKLKAAKLLYFCDKYHLLKYGRPVMGDVYFCLDHGPVPSASLNLMNDAMNPDDFKGRPAPFQKLFQRFLDVDKTCRYPVFVRKADPGLDLFSKSEIEALDFTVQKYGRLSPWRLRGLSHRDPTWFIPDGERPSGSRADIPYELFFEGQPDDVRDMLSLVEEEQAESKFARQLAR